MDLNAFSGNKYWLSILVPTKYPDRYKKFYESLVTNCKDREGIEIVTVVDDNGKSLKRGDGVAYFDETNLTIEAGVTRSEHLQWAIECARGEFVWFANDDITCETHGWDQRFKEAISKFSDKIVLAWPYDGVFNQRLSIFPIIKKSIVEKFFPLPYQRYKIDDTIFDVMPPRRRVYLDDVRMVHGDGKNYSCEPTSYQHDEQHFIQRMPQRASIRSEIRKLIPDYKNYKVFLAVPRYIKPATNEFYDHYFILDRPDNCIASFCTGQSPAKNRNIMIQQARDAGCTHIMLLDDDVEYNSDIIFRLLDHDVDIVSGLYFKRDYPHEPITFETQNEQGWVSFHKLNKNLRGLTETKGSGFGCCLMKMSVFDKLDAHFGEKAKPYIRLGEIEADNWCDDTGFFMRTTQAGIKSHVDFDCFVGHTGKVSIWPNRVGDQFTVLYRVGATAGTVQFPHPWSEQK